MADKLTAVFDLEKETKNTMRFSEDPEAAPIMNTAYIQKWALKQLGNPEKVRITIEAVED
jgi:hypothetical protein